MHIGMPNPATAASSSATNVNPVTLPLPLSRGGSPSEPQQRIDGAQPKRSRVEGQPSSTVGNLPEAQRRSSLETRDIQVSKPTSLGKPTAKRSARDSRSSAGVAAIIALDNCRQSEGSNPDLSSAVVSAKMAAKEAQVVGLQIKELDTFANSAAVLAHKTALPAATSAGIGTLQVEHNTSVTIHSVAALSAAKSTQKAVKKALAETEVPRKRKVMTGDLEEAAQKAAARRLALLDREFYEAGVLLRFPTPEGETESRWLTSLRRSSLVGEISPVKASSPSQATGLNSYSNLMDIAKRNVESRLRGIDVEVADKKGLVYRKDWNNKAMVIAEKRVQNSMRAREGGKIDIGGGRCVDEEVVEEIALRRVQPILQALTAKAEAERARVAAERAEIEERKQKENLEKERNRKLRQEEKQAKAAEKAELSRQKSEAQKERGAESREIGSVLKPVGSPAGVGLASVQISSALKEQKSKLRKLIGRFRSSSLKSTPSAAAYEGERFKDGVGHTEIAPRSRIDRDKAGGPDPDVAEPPPQEPSHTEMEFSEPSGDRAEYIDTEEGSWRNQTYALALNPPNSDIPVSMSEGPELSPELNSPLAVKMEPKGKGVASEPLLEHTLPEQPSIAPNTLVQEIRPVKRFEERTVSNQIPVLAVEEPESPIDEESLGSPTVNGQNAPVAYSLGRNSERSKFKEEF